MVQEEPAARFYDFLYRDHARFSSYYAQLFGGKLATIERQVAKRQQKDLTGKVGAPFLGGERKSSTDQQESTKEVIEPHDVAVVDVLSRLSELAVSSGNAADAPPGSIILLEGSIVFVDRGMIEIARLFFDSLVESEEKKPKNKRDKKVIDSVGGISRVLEKLTIPSSLCFQSVDGLKVVGIIHDEGMSEPISSYYFKHGSEGIPGVYLIGIKDAKTASIQVPETDLTSTVRRTADVLGKFLFPEDAIRITPVAIFRKVGSTGNSSTLTTSKS